MAVRRSVIQAAPAPSGRVVEPAPFSASNGVWSAVVALGLFLVGLAFTTVLATDIYPFPTDPASTVAHWRVENGQNARTAAFFYSVSAIGVMWFSAWLGALLARRGRSEASLLALAGGLTSAAFLLLTGILQWVATRPESLRQPNLDLTLHQILFVTGGPGVVAPLALLTGAGSTALVRTGLIGRLLAAFGLVAAVLSLLSLIALVPEDDSLATLIPGGRVMALVWMLLVALAVARRTRRRI